GLEKKFLQLGGALAVAPVADPDEIAVFFGALDRIEGPHVGGLVPYPDAPRPAARLIDARDCRAIGEHAVVARKIVRRHRLRLGNRAMVRVVKEERVTAARLAVRAER